MNRETFLDSFGHIADAPGGIDRLRGLILDLAVRGRLTERHDGDEPVDDLLVRIDRERDRKVAERMMRRPRARLDVSEGELRHLIPAEWKWVKVARIAQVVGGGTPTAGDASNFAEPGIPWITPADMEQGRIRRIERGERSLSEKGYSSCSASLMPAGSLVMSSRAPIGYVAVAANELCTNQGFKSLVPHAMECSAFLFWALRAYRSVIESLGSGTTFREVSGGVVEALSLPLPSVQEQHRIVERVDELMALCDDLEEQQAARAEARAALTAATMRHVADAETADDLRAAIASFADRIDLHLAPGDGELAAVKRLRQTIFDLAVRGRLTYQDPADLPAAALLDQIASERDRLIRAKEIRKPKKFDEMTASRGAADLPSGWAWARANQFFIASDSGWSPQCMVESAGPGDWGVLKTSAVSRGVFDPDENKKLPRTLEPRPKLEVHPGEFVMIRASGSKSLVGRGAIVTETESRLMLSDKHIRLTFLHEASTRFWAIVNESTAVQAYYSDESSGTSTMSNVTRDRIGALAVAVPPLAEQLRIVEAVDTLLGLCDDLEQQFIAAGSLREDLAASIAAHSVPSRPRELCESGGTPRAAT